MTQVVNPEHEKLTPTPEVKLTPEANAEKPVQAVEEKLPAGTPTGEIEIHRGALDGLPRTFLKSGAETRVERLNVPGFIETVNSDMRSTDQAKAAEATDTMVKENDDERAVEVIEDQLESGKVEGSLVFVLSNIFRSFGKEIFTVPEGGFDPRQMGNQVNFENKAKYVIPESQAEKMKGLLGSTPATLGESSAAFHIKTKDAIDGKDGFEAVYQYKTPSGEEVTANLLFLYGKEKVQEAEPVAEVSQANEMVTEVEAAPVVEEKPKAEEPALEKPVEPVVDSAEPESESGTNGENDEGVNNNQENTGDTVAESADTLSDGSIRDTTDHNKGVLKGVKVNTGMPSSNPLPSQTPVSGDLSKAA